MIIYLSSFYTITIFSTYSMSLQNHFTNFRLFDFHCLPHFAVIILPHPLFPFSCFIHMTFEFAASRIQLGDSQCRPRKPLTPPTMSSILLDVRFCLCLELYHTLNYIIEYKLLPLEVSSELSLAHCPDFFRSSFMSTY